MRLLAQQVFLLSQPSPRPPVSHHSEPEILVCLWSGGQGFQLMHPGAPPASAALGLLMNGTTPLFVCLFNMGRENQTQVISLTSPLLTELSFQPQKGSLSGEKCMSWGQKLWLECDFA